MTQADFYILAGQQRQDQWLFACRLAEQLQRKGRHVLLQVDDEQTAIELDQYLWTFREDAFVPHACLNSAEAPVDCAVSISWHDDPQHHHDVLISLGGSLPPFFARFKRLVEVVIQEDRVLEKTREHYRFLKDRGYPLNNKDMRMKT